MSVVKATEAVPARPDAEPANRRHARRRCYSQHSHPDHETDRSVTEIGRRLGSSETAAFSGAFRRWTGTSPDTWRRQHNEPDQGRQLSVHHDPSLGAASENISR